ncbi:glycosyltransferase family 2 protein [Candidatus Saccharibacteria bacterium]|nr:glycosyltransferase family 2 protein [Candidatus Saccharibacteria bacterium]
MTIEDELKPAEGSGEDYGPEDSFVEQALVNSDEKTDRLPFPETALAHPVELDGRQTDDEADSLLRFMTRKAEKLSPHILEIRKRNLDLWAATNPDEFGGIAYSWMSEIRDGNQSGNPGLKVLRGDESTKPHVSVVVPAHNEERYIVQLLASLAAQEYSESVEVIIVDNNSDLDDRTTAFAERCGARVISYNLLDDDHNKTLSQIALARQRGLEAAVGDVIISTDADVIVPKGWIDAMVSHLDQDLSTVVVTGDIKNYDMPPILAGQDWARRVGRIAMTIHLNNNMLRGWGKSPGNGANTAFRREQALELGGYNTEVYPGEDTELTHRLSEGNAVILFLTGLEARVAVSARRYEGMRAVALARSFFDYKSVYRDGSGNPITKR